MCVFKTSKTSHTVSTSTVRLRICRYLLVQYFRVWRTRKKNVLDQFRTVGNSETWCYHRRYKCLHNFCKLVWLSRKTSHNQLSILKQLLIGNLRRNLSHQCSLKVIWTFFVLQIWTPFPCIASNLNSTTIHVLENTWVVIKWTIGALININLNDIPCGDVKLTWLTSLKTALRVAV